MSTLNDFIIARSVVREALCLREVEAAKWLVTNVGWFGDKDISELYQKLSGPHGYTMVKIIEARKTNKESK